MLWSWMTQLLRGWGAGAPRRVRPRRRPHRRYFRPELTLLEDRLAPARLSVGANVNVSSFLSGSPPSVASWPGDQIEPSITINPTNPNNLFAVSINGNQGTSPDNVNGGLLASVSFDGGLTWTSRNIFPPIDVMIPSTMVGPADLTADPTMNPGPNPVPAIPASFQPAADMGHPRAVFDQYGNLFVAYGTSQGNIVVLYSPNGGQNFIALPNNILTTTLTYIVGGTPTQVQAELVMPSIAVGANQLWISATDVNTGSIVATGAPVTGPGQLHIGSFMPFQVVYQGPQNGTPYGQRANFSDVAIGPNGQVLVSFQSPDLGLGPATIYVARDGDGINLTQGFGPPIPVVTTQVGGHAYQVLAQSTKGIYATANMDWDRSGGPYHGRVYLVYTNSSGPNNQDTNIFMVHSNDNGTTWSAPVLVNDPSPASQFMPEVAVDPITGWVAVAWYDTRNAPNNQHPQLFATVSIDGGRRFLCNVAVSAGFSNAIKDTPPLPTADNAQQFGDRIGLAFYNRRFFPAWSDNTPNNPAPTVMLPGRNSADLHFDIGTAPVDVIVPGSNVVAGVDAGRPPLIQVFDAHTGTLRLAMFAYDPAFLGGVRVAMGDINNDGFPDIVTAPGPGGGPHIRVFNGLTGIEFAGWMAFGGTWFGGSYVASADVNGDGFAEVIVGADAGGGPRVQVFDGLSILQAGAGLIPSPIAIGNFFAYAPTFRGGVRVAAGLVNGDRFADIVTAPGPGGGPHIRVFAGGSPFGPVPTAINNFFAYGVNFTGGVYVAVGSCGSVVTAPGAGGGPHIRIFQLGPETRPINSSYFVPLATSLYFGDQAIFNTGVRVATADVNGDGFADIITSYNAGGPRPVVRAFDYFTGQLLRFYFGSNPERDDLTFIGGGIF
ncbi:MAG: FG-GAP-like repeat-containing protein [Gemmataceae bacterium]|nr:FG-GAP-like repeat-containing protein [Gemmataceae bacterium]